MMYFISASGVSKRSRHLMSDYARRAAASTQVPRRTLDLSSPGLVCVAASVVDAALHEASVPPWDHMWGWLTVYR